MKRYLFIALLTTQAAIGQTVDSITAFPAKNNFRRGLFFETGPSHTLTLLPTIRSFFRDNQIQPDSPFGLFYGFGGGIRLRRVKIMVQGGSGLQENRAYSGLPEAGFESVARNSIANYISLSVGYDIVNARNRRLYVNLGLGGLEYGFNIYRRSNQVVPFQTILQVNQPGNVSSLLLQNVGYADFGLEYAQREKRRKDIENVLRLGYRMGTFAKAYESDAYQLTDAPRDRIGQIYLQYMLRFSLNADRLRLR